MADKSISELVAATSVGSTDLFVLEQANTAKKLPGQILENWLVSFADGHGGIQSWSYTPPVAPSLEGTLTLTLADTTVITVPIMNGAKGDTGSQTYVWIRWAAQNPTADNQLSTTPDAWIGIYVGLSATAPTTRGSYTWYQYKGAQGDKGDQGESIATVTRTGGDGSPGSTDTYTITLSDGTVAGTFTVYNGLNGTGAVASVNGVTPDPLGNVNLTAANVGALPDTTTYVSTVNGLAGAAVVNKMGTITIPASWSGSGPYTRVVTVSGAVITNNSKVDLQPDAATLQQLIDDGVSALYIRNNNGTLTAYAIGAAPSVQLAVQCVVTEVVQ